MNKKIDKREATTLANYSERADDFWAGTKDHDVSQNIRALLNQLPKNTALDILDFGCGPGRDLLTFKQLGHRALGVDGTEKFCQMAKDYSDCEVLHQNFLALDLGEQRFDGIFANASLFHVPSEKLVSVLQQLYRSLKPQGVLFSSNPRGHKDGFQGERYAHFMEFDDSKAYLEEAGFTVVDHYYRPEGVPREQQSWLAIVSRR